MSRKRQGIIIFTSVFWLITIAPLIGFATDYLVVLDRTNTPVKIDQASFLGLQKAFAYPIRLSREQKANIDFSMSMPNTTLTLKIFDKDIYEYNFLLNTSPVYINGEDFLYVRESPYFREYPSNHRTIYEQGSWHIKFSGGIYGSDLVYRPGNYMVVVYGTTEDVQEDNPLAFNLLIKLDGPGRFIELVLIIFGLLVLICYCLLITINYIRKIELPYKKKIKKDQILLIQS